VAPTLTHATTIGFTVTLFLVGAQLSRKTLRSVGLPAMCLGVGLWLLIGGGSLWTAMRRGEGKFPMGYGTTPPWLIYLSIWRA
jgi:hypothetical protein